MRPLALGLLASLAPAAAAADPSVTVLPLPFAVTEFRGPESRAATVAPSMDALRGKRLADRGPLIVVWGGQDGAALTLVGDRVQVIPMQGSAGDLAAAERGRASIPESRVTVAGPLSASLTDPTPDQPHRALGSRTQARAVTIGERRAVPPGPDPRPVPVETTRIEAGEGAVFEDREVRADGAQRGRPPVLVTIKSYKERGAALAIIDRRDGVWQVAAETAPTGEPETWLNPAALWRPREGGPLQIALVARPHRDGPPPALVLRRRAADAARARRPGYSNHAFGLTAQDLATRLDPDEGGREVIAIPSLDRASLALVSFGPRDIVERGASRFRRGPATGVARLGRGRDTHILVGLEDGRVVDVRP
jgi:hypothetical protein